MYPYTGLPGQVNLYSEATVASSGNVDGIPTTSQLEDVLYYITFDENGLATRRSANSFVNSLPITRVAFDVTVVGISGVDNVSDVQDSIQAALEEYFLQAEPYIVGLAIPPRLDRLTRTKVSALVEDIVTSAAGIFNNTQFRITGTNDVLDSYVLQEGQKAKLANLSFN